MDVHEYTSRVRAIETKLYRCAKCILKNDTDAADAVQEALLSAWRNLSSLRNEDYFETWLIRIVINECKRLIKKRDLLREEVLSPTLAAPPEEEKNVYAFLMQLDQICYTDLNQCTFIACSFQHSINVSMETATYIF